MYRLHAFSSLLPFLFCLFPELTLAQDTDSETDSSNSESVNELQYLFDMSLEELLKVKVTTATLQGETLKTVPSSITIISREEIKRIGATKLEEIVKFVPGFQSNRTGSSGVHTSLVSRGRRIGQAGKEVLILLDGRRINEDWAGGHVFNNRQVSIEHAQRVEFIRGPGSSIYGTNAFLGVINIVTGNHNEIRGALGSHNMLDTSIQVAKAYENGEVSFFAKRNVDEGESIDTYRYQDDVFLSNKDPFENYELYLKGSYGSFNSKVRLLERESNQFYATHNAGLDGNHWNTKLVYFDLGYDTALNEQLYLSSNFFYTKFDTKSYTTIDLTPFLGHQQNRKLADSGGFLHFKYNNKAGTRWLLGYEYRHPEMIEARNQHVGSSTDLFITQSESPRTIQGLFGQYQYDINSHFNYILGVRIDEFSDVGSHVSPRAGLVYLANEQHSYKFLYGEAFRAPSRNEVDTINIANLEGNPDLSPEVSKTWEFVWQITMRSSYVSTTLFSTEIEDNIIATPSSISPGKRTWVNTGVVYISGLELEWRNEWSGTLNTRLAVTHLFDNAEARSAESDSLLTAVINYAQPGYAISLVSGYESVKYDKNNTVQGFNRLSERVLFSGKISYLSISKLDLYLKINNITDKSYISPTSQVADTVGIPNRGRTFELGVNYDF